MNAFENIDTKQNQELIVIEDENIEIIGTLQLFFIQYLIYRGEIRVQIETVKVPNSHKFTPLSCLLRMAYFVFLSIR